MKKNAEPLPLYDPLPDGCLAHVVADHEAEPLLFVGDIAVVDTRDLMPRPGSLYVIDYGRRHGRVQRYIVQLARRQHWDGRKHYFGWWARAYNGPPAPDQLAGWVKAGRAITTSDGPYAETVEGLTLLREQLVGRIIGRLDPSAVEPCYRSPDNG